MAVVEAERAPGIDGLGLPAGDSGKQGICGGPAVLQGLSGRGQDLHGVLGVAPSCLQAQAMLPSGLVAGRKESVSSTRHAACATVQACAVLQCCW